MKKNKIFDPVDPKILLSTLWIFILFCIFFADFQWIITSGALVEISSGVVRGNEVSENLLVVASIVHLIPVSMVLFSRITTRKVNRWLNISMGLLVLLMTSGGWTTPDQIIFKMVEVIALVVIIWTAVKWKK